MLTFHVLALKTIHTMYNQGLYNYTSLGSQLTLPVYFMSSSDNYPHYVQLHELRVTVDKESP
jgi:hypothetical protein